MNSQAFIYSVKIKHKSDFVKEMQVTGQNISFIFCYLDPFTFPLQSSH